MSGPITFEHLVSMARTCGKKKLNDGERQELKRSELQRESISAKREHNIVSSHF
jgi:hypothetical protein